MYGAVGKPTLADKQPTEHTTDPQLTLLSAQAEIAILKESE
jgi:hypothetical protein